MKSARLSISQEYLRFTIEADGEEMTGELEKTFSDILEGDLSGDSAVAAFIRSENLNTDNTETISDELSKYPGTRCLVNYFGIKDKPALKHVDKMISSLRTAELLHSPLDMPFTFDYLKAVHSHLFGDIYPSAGMIRKSLSSKHTEFCQPEFIESQAEILFSKLRDDRYLRSIDDVDDFVNELAYYMGEMEALHPFMDGNGRASRFFFNSLSLSAGYEIGWGSADPDHFLEANVAALDGDYQALIDVLEEIVIPLSED